MIDSVLTLGVHTLCVVVSFVIFLVFFLQSFEVHGTDPTCVSELEQHSSHDVSVLYNLSLTAMALLTGLTVSRCSKYYSVQQMMQKDVSTEKRMSIQWASLLDWSPKFHIDQEGVNGETTRTKAFKLVIFLLHGVSIICMALLLDAVSDVGDDTMCYHKMDGSSAWTTIQISVGLLSAAIFIEVCVLLKYVYQLYRPGNYGTKVGIRYGKDQITSQATKATEKAIHSFVMMRNVSNALLLITATAATILFWAAVDKNCSSSMMLKLIMLVTFTIMGFGLVITNAQNHPKIKLYAKGCAAGSAFSLIAVLMYDTRRLKLESCHESSDTVKWMLFAVFVLYLLWVSYEILTRYVTNNEAVQAATRNLMEKARNGQNRLQSAFGKEKDKNAGTTEAHADFSNNPLIVRQSQGSTVDLQFV